MAKMWGTDNLTTDQEIARTVKVIADRASQGADNTAQMQHYKNLTGNDYKTSQYNIDRTTSVIQDRMKQGLDTASQLQHYKNITGRDYVAPAAPAQKPNPVVQPQQNAFDQQAYAQQMQGYVNQAFDQQKQAQMEQLKASQNKAVGQINQQKAETAPAYQQKRNQADVVNTQNAQRLREMMAANGLTASGENITAQTSLSNERLNSLNSLNLQEQQQMNDYDRRITDVMDPASEQAMVAALEAERNKALYDAYIRADETGYSRNRDNVMDQRYANEMDYNRNRDYISDSRYADDTNYNRGRDTVSDSQWQQSFDQQGNQWQQSFDQQNKDAETERAWREYTYNNMSASEKSSLDWAKQQYGEDAAWRMYAMEYEGEMNKSMNQAQIDAMGDPLSFLP